MFHWLTSPKISWRPRRVDGVVLLQKPAGSRPRRNWSFSLNPKAWGKMITQLEGSQIGGIPPYSGNGQPWVPFRPSVIGWGPPSLQRATCFIQSIDLNTKLVQKKNLSETTRITFDQISGNPMVQWRWYIKLSYNEISLLLGIYPGKTIVLKDTRSTHNSTIHNIKDIDTT